MTALKFPPIKTVRPDFSQTFAYTPKVSFAKSTSDAFVTMPKEVTSAKMGDAKFQSLKNFLKGIFKN
ncbi:hypothetical protein IKU74_08590 [bacterium]|nr:hypothetical protein [bacterium]